MKSKRYLFLWIVSIILAFTVAYFQMITGPNYPVKVQKEFKGQQFSFEVPRTSDSDGDEKIEIKIPVGDLTNTFTGIIRYKLFKSCDEWTTDTMKWEGGRKIVASIPHQLPAEKIIYDIFFVKDNDIIKMTENPVVMNFKGKVPVYVLLPYIVLIFLAILFSIRTCFEALFKGISTFRYSFLTLVFLFIGGGILLPVVQKYAFNAYWIGWPVGLGLSNIKTLVAIAFWFIAFFYLAKNRNIRWWPVIACVMLLAVYLIPE